MRAPHRVSLCPLDNLAKFYRVFDNGYDMHYPTAFLAFERIYLVHYPSMGAHPARNFVAIRNRSVPTPVHVQVGQGPTDYERRRSLLYSFPVSYQVFPGFIIDPKSLSVNELFGDTPSTLEMH